MSDKLLEQVFNLKFTAKQLNRSAAKCEKDEKAERLKVKKAIEKGNMEGAAIYAQNAIRKKNEQLNYLKLASQLDAVASRLDTQAKMQMVSKNMASITKSISKVMGTVQLEDIAGTMQKFGKLFEDLEVQTEVVSGVMGQQAALSTPEDEVTALMQQVAEENNLEFAMAMPGASGSRVPAQATQVDDLKQRLAGLGSG